MRSWAQGTGKSYAGELQPIERYTGMSLQELLRYDSLRGRQSGGSFFGFTMLPIRCMFTIAARVATISNWFSILTLLQITASSSLYIDSRQDLNPADMETLRIRIGCMSLWVLHSMIALNCQSLAIPVNVSIPCHWVYAVSSEPRQNP